MNTHLNMLKTDVASSAKLIAYFAFYSYIAYYTIIYLLEVVWVCFRIVLLVIRIGCLYQQKTKSRVEVKRGDVAVDDDGGETKFGEQVG